MSGCIFDILDDFQRAYKLCNMASRFIGSRVAEGNPLGASVFTASMASLAAWQTSLNALGEAGVEGVDHACAVLTTMLERTTLVSYLDRLRGCGRIQCMASPHFVIGHALAAACAAGLLRRLGPLGPQHAAEGVRSFMDILLQNGQGHLIVLTTPDDPTFAFDVPLDLLTLEAVELAMPGFSQWVAHVLGTGVVDPGQGVQGGRGAVPCNAVHAPSSTVEATGGIEQGVWSVQRPGSEDEPLPEDMATAVNRAWVAGARRVSCKWGGDSFVVDLAEMKLTQWNTLESARLVRGQRARVDAGESADAVEAGRGRSRSRSPRSAEARSLENHANEREEAELDDRLGQGYVDARLQEHLHHEIVALLPVQHKRSLLRMCSPAMLVLLQDRMDAWRGHSVEVGQAALMREALLAMRAGQKAAGEREEVGSTPDCFRQG